MKDKAKENDFKSQVDKMGNAIEKSRMETAVNRYVLPNLFVRTRPSAVTNSFSDLRK